MSIFREALFARQRLNSNKFKPVTLAVNITGLCNFTCDFCEKADYKVKNEISFDRITKLLSFAKDSKLDVFFGGGEPFLHTKFWDILRYCSQIKLKISIVTNGSLLWNLSEEKQRLLNETISVMSISIDSAVAEEHNKIRGYKKSFERAVGYILNSSRRHKIGINSVLSVDFHNVMPMLELAAQLNVSVNFQPLIFESNYPGLSKTNWKNGIPGQMNHMGAHNFQKLRQLNAYARKRGVVTNLSLILFYIEQYYNDAATDKFFFDRLVRDFMCFMPLNQVTVNENGEIAPCPFLFGKASIDDKNLEEA